MAIIIGVSRQLLDTGQCFGLAGEGMSMEAAAHMWYCVPEYPGHAGPLHPGYRNRNRAIDDLLVVSTRLDTAGGLSPPHVKLFNSLIGVTHFAGACVGMVRPPSALEPAPSAISNPSQAA